MKSLMKLALMVAVASIVAFPLRAQEKTDRGRQPGAAEARLLDNVFEAPRGAAVSDEQQAKLRALREQRGPELAAKLQELQRKRDEVYTAEQLAARRDAFQAARTAGKTGEALRQDVDAAVKLTEQQQAQLAALQRQQQELLAPIRQEIATIVGIQQRDRRRAGQKEQPQESRIPPTQANVKYGPHQRNVLDFWQAKSDKPTPVLVSIHGGGFRGGNKSVSGSLLQQCLDAGISVAAITYRLSDQAIAPAQFTDAARAIQFIRSKAKEWNLDSRRLAATGGSAGAGISLWLGFHDDMADPDNADPILRQSTRLSGMFVTNGQTSYDPRFIRQLFPGKDTYQHSALAQLFDVELDNLDNLPAEKYRLFEEVSSINYLTKDDPPAILTYNSALETEVTNQSIGIHHPRFGVALKEKMDALGIRCEVVANGKSVGSESPTSTIDFLKQVFEMTK